MADELVVGTQRFETALAKRAHENVEEAGFHD